MDGGKKTDPRFAQTLYDPRFGKMNKKIKKVKIDDRFKDLVHNQEKYDKTQDLYYLNQ